MKKSLACFFALFFGCLAVSAQVPALLKDLNNGLVSGSPRGMTTVGNTVYFSARDAVHGRELWKTTGTEATTVMVADINTSGSSNPANFCNVNGTVFFTVTTANNGYQLWKTDGTAAGTKFVSDMLLGNENGSFAQLTACNGKLFFRSYVAVVPPPGGAPSLDLKLFVSDGTIAGTKVLANTLSLPANLTAVGNTLYLSGISPTSPNGNQVLKTDGVTVFVVKDFKFPNETANDLPGNFTNVNGVLFFSAKILGADGRQIWKTSGSNATTFRMTNVDFGFNVSEMTHLNGTVFFAGVQATPFGNSGGNHIFRLNSNSLSEFFTSSAANLTPSSNALIFTQITQFESELSAITVNGNGIFHIKVFPVSGVPSNLTVAGGNTFFVAGTDADGRELWKSNALGTGMVQNFMAGSASAGISDLCALGNEVLFACDGVGGTIGGNELRRATSALNSIVTVRNIGRAGSFPKEFVQMGSFVFFTADDVDAGRELWKTTGAIGNAVRVADLISGPTGSEPSNLIVITSTAGVQTLFFEAKSINNGRELFKLENTVGATPICISDIAPGAGNAGIGNMTNVNGTLHFTAAQAFGLGDRIWKVNAARTQAEKTGGDMTFANNLVAMGSTLFFTQSPQVGPRLLNKIVNGTTSLVRSFQFSAGFADPIPQELIVIGSRLFFTAGDGQQSRRVWVTNASATSASFVSTHAAADLTNFNGRLVFTAPSANIAGQRSILRVNLALNGADVLATGSSIGGLRAAGTNLFFLQPFNSGIVSLSKITTNSNNIVPLGDFSIFNSLLDIQMIVAGNNLYFTMSSAATGNELWKSNGSSVAVLVSDIRPGVGNSNVQSLRLCGSDLFFSANNLINGQEPWKLANASAAQGDEAGEREAEEAIEVEAVPTVVVPEIKVYPNPTSNYVNVDLPQNEMTGTLSILSASGQMVRSVQSSEGEASIQLDVQDLPKGVYLVRWVQSDDQIVVKKLIVQ